MREIKLRIWDRGNERMIYSYEPDDDEQGKREYYPIGFAIGYSHYDKSQFSEPMFFTGKYDKNKFPIYEGDILKTWIEEVLQKTIYVVNDLRELYFECNREDSYHRITSMKIIGNKYENKELLNSVGII